MTAALIFAGGTGSRMNSRSKPKQFLEMHGKPILIYTLEHFERHDEIDAIVIVCIREWIEALKTLLWRFGIKKVKGVVGGGSTGHDSIYCGLKELEKICGRDDIVLIHDGVRPLITEELITRNIMAVREFGSAITCEAARESIIRSEDGRNICDAPPRDQIYVAKAPQSFYFGKILHLYDMACRDNLKTIDSACLCSIYKETMHIVMSTKNNIKITEPADYYIYRALYEALENQQIFGI